MLRPFILFTFSRRAYFETLHNLNILNYEDLFGLLFICLFCFQIPQVSERLKKYYRLVSSLAMCVQNL